ncbi:class I SAM-dependent methyltransferase [Paenibacillus sp. FSL H8-0034]|uniref:class I SAM-dependent methyltransferase n=1 Tax=Paenibacillus sp. FSL H8-0034 TaxID=2954671 RepID=UPI0030FB5E5B
MTNPYFGWGKFKDMDQDYFSYIDTLAEMNIDAKELIFQFPVFVGHVNLGRYLFFYDLYKKVMNLNGHIADVGTYKGASFLFFSKLIRLFESYATTQVHGFDWFKGMNPSEDDDPLQKDRYIGDFETLSKWIELQQLKDISIVHKMDVTQELDGFLQQNRHLRFKIVFIDCGVAGVIEKSLECLWPRLVNGGILIMDHFNCEVSPAESILLDKFIGNQFVRQMPFNRQPTCYVIKEQV